MSLKIVGTRPDCLMVTIETEDTTGAGLSGALTLTNYETGIVISHPLTFAVAGEKLSSDITLTTNGVFEVAYAQGGSIVAEVAFIASCDIDCCLTKLTEELINCGCECPRCSKALAKAQKIFLLISTANASAEQVYVLGNTGYVQNAYDKYKKAKELCDLSCGCNC